MKPPPFEYFEPDTLDDALALIERHGEACKVIAGGQSLIPMMNLRVVHPEILVDINRISDLDYIRMENGSLCIGALSRHATVMSSNAVAEACPLMAEAYPHVSHGPVRNRGTLGGNLAHADPASEMPAVSLAVDTEIVLRSAKGERTLPADAFFLSALTTAAEPNELLTEIRVPQAPAGQGWSFQEVSGRKGDFAYVAAAALLSIENGACASARLAFAGVRDRAYRDTDAEGALVGEEPGEVLFVRIANMASEAADPGEDYHADAAYRRDLVRALTKRTLAQATSRCQ